MTIEVYTLRALAVKESVNYGSLRRIVAGFDKDSPRVWRNYRFFRVGDAKAWFAVDKDADLAFIDNP